MNEKLKEPLPKRLREVPGYLKRVSNFSLDRQKEASRRYYGKLAQA